MKTNTLINRGYRYYVRLSGNRLPVLGSMIVRKNKPRSANGDWVDITSCLEDCCAITLTAVDTTLVITEESGNIITLAGITSSSGSEITITPISTSGITIAEDGEYTTTSPANEDIVVIASDGEGNTLQINITVNV